MTEIDPRFKIAVLGSIEHSAVTEDELRHAKAQICAFALKHGYFPAEFTSMLLFFANDRDQGCFTAQGLEAQRELQNDLNSTLQCNSQHWIVALDVENQIRGFACFNFLTTGKITVVYLFVDPVVRRCGLGTRLLRGIERIALTSGISLISIDSEDNMDSMTFYAKRGYHIAAKTAQVGLCIPGSSTPCTSVDCDKYAQLVALLGPMLGANLPVAPSALEIGNMNRQARLDANSATEYLRSTQADKSIATFELRFGQCFSNGKRYRTIWFDRNIPTKEKASAAAEAAK